MRLIDLHCNWALQYACETTQYDPELYGDIQERTGQIEAYLSETSVSLLACGRRATDWTRRKEPWTTLGEMITRYEAEFPGRLLLGPEDVARWTAEPPDGICWGMLGVEGFDALVRGSGDLDRLPGLFARGVRVFQLVETGSSLLGGAAVAGDDRGLSELGRAFLERLLTLAPEGTHPGPRPVVDLADLNARSSSDVLVWFEADSSRVDRLLLVRSHGHVEIVDRAGGGGLSRPNLSRFRALGGLVGLSVGLPYIQTPDDLRRAIESVASIPFAGRSGFEGIGIGTDALSLTSSLDRLASVARIIAWLTETFDPEIASLVASGNARGFLEQATGAQPR